MGMQTTPESPLVLVQLIFRPRRILSVEMLIFFMFLARVCLVSYAVFDDLVPDDVHIHVDGPDESDTTFGWGGSYTVSPDHLVVEPTSRTSVLLLTPRRRLRSSSI
jgi:hypothetical protein